MTKRTGRPTGRPSVFRWSVVEQVADEIAEGVSIRNAALMHNVTWPTLKRWMQDKPGVRQLIDRAAALSSAKAEKKLLTGTESELTHIDRRKRLKNQDGSTKIVKEVIRKRENLASQRWVIERREKHAERALAEEAARETYAGPPHSIEGAMARLGMVRESWAPWRRPRAGDRRRGVTTPTTSASSGSGPARDPPIDAVREIYGVVGRRGGKALALDTPIPTRRGWMAMEDIRPGDDVMHPGGGWTRVEAVTPPFVEPAYAVSFSDGSRVVAGEGHLWRTTRRAGGGKRVTGIVTTAEIAGTLYASSPKREHRHRIAVAAPLAFPTRPLGMSAYVLGLWLGDGDARSLNVTVADDLPETLRLLVARGIAAPHVAQTHTAWRVSLSRRGPATPIRREMERIGVLGRKHVPEEYLCASEPDRWELLRGLMDAAGYADRRGRCEFTTVNRLLAEGVWRLVRSLGLKARIGEGRATLGGRDCGPRWRVTFVPGPQSPVFGLRRKQARLKPLKGAMTRWVQVVGCEPVGDRAVKCIQVAAVDGMFVAGYGCIPTHNSQFAGVVAVVRACRRYPRVVSPEVAVIARTMPQGRVVADYARDAAARLGVLGKRSSALVIPVKWGDEPGMQGATIRVQPNSSSVRGPTVVTAILDELAHYNTDPAAAWSDRDLMTALTPALATVRMPLLLGISSPWKRRGVLAEAWKEWLTGKRPRNRIVWHGPTRAMNPSISQQRIDDEIAANPSLAAEFSAEFFAEGGSWLPPWVLADDVVKAMPAGPVKTQAKRGDLFAFCDAASGGGADSFCLAIAERMVPKELDWLHNKEREHPENRRARLLELLTIEPPFMPEVAVARAAAVLRKYGLTLVTGDRWAAGMQDAVWRQHGIAYDKTPDTRSDIYHGVLPAMLSGRVDLIREERLITELQGLIEVAGRDAPAIIDHPAGEHDDVSNAACGALLMALGGRELVVA